jgi:putative membrane protein
LETEKGFTARRDNRNNTSKPAHSLKPVFDWVLRVFKGAIIGTGAILPGISGGVLCVVLGVYQPMMALLAHPIKTFKTHARLLFPIIIGVALGFVGLARVVEWMFNASFNLAVWLFIGLIIGTLPSLFEEAGKEGRTSGSWAALGFSSVAVFGILLFLKSGTSLNITPNIGWFFVCGILWGVSLVAPGMSSSSILIFLGLYEPMAAGIADLSPHVMFPLIAGILLMLIVSARAVNYLFEKHYSIAFHIIIGFVIASTLIIIPLNFKNTADLVFSIGCFVVGFAVAWAMDRIGKKIKPQNQDDTYGKADTILGVIEEKIDNEV